MNRLPKGNVFLISLTTTMPTKKTNFHKRELGSGAFTVEDVSMILGQSHQKVYRYIKEYGDVKFGKLYNETYSWSVDKTLVVNFYALIELHVIFLLMETHKIKLSEINKAREVLAKSFGTPYPLATQKIFTDKKDILYKHLDEYVNANKTHQFNLKEIVAPSLKKVEWKNGAAYRYFPLGKQHSVVVDPLRQHGQPTIIKSNLRTQTIWRMYESGEPKENIKTLYDLTTKELDDALLFYKSINKAA